MPVYDARAFTAVRHASDAAAPAATRRTLIRYIFDIFFEMRHDAAVPRARHIDDMLCHILPSALSYALRRVCVQFRAVMRVPPRRDKMFEASYAALLLFFDAFSPLRRY